MAEGPHYKDLLQRFNDSGVEYLIVGAHAVMRYSEPRFTKDLDLWVRNSAGNSRKVYNALAEFGAPLQDSGVTPQTFAEEKLVYQLGVAPVRVDISTFIDGVAFEQAWNNRVQSTFFGVVVNFISLSDLIVNKRAAGRARDLEDLRHLSTPTDDS